MHLTGPGFSDLAHRPDFFLANHTRVTGPAFYDPAHGPDFFFAA